MRSSILLSEVPSIFLSWLNRSQLDRAHQIDVESEETY